MATPSSLCKLEISNFLQDLGCCSRCCLRFLREREDCSYINEESIFQNIKENVGGNNEPAHKVLKPNPCIVCLGLLQDSNYMVNLDNVCKQVLDNKYDSKTFTCSLTLPIAIMLREHCIWLKLCDKFGEVYKDLNKAEWITSLKDVWKNICMEELEKQTGKKLEHNSSPFQVQVHVSYEKDELECSHLLDMCPEKFKHRYRQTRVYRSGIFTRSAVQSALAAVKAEVFSKHYQLLVPNVSFSYGSVTCSHSSLYIAGRYNKFSRTLSQTPWIIDGEKRMETSVQELICDHLIPFFQAQSSKFSASGREDVDVRTLGNGRPFVVELIEPHRTCYSLQEIEDLENQINKSTSDIAVRDLQIVSKDQLAFLKEGEEGKTKSYSALCLTLDGSPLSPSEVGMLSNIKELTIQQKTPLRVLHRRPLAVRPRMIHKMSVDLLPNLPNYFILRLHTQAGTYIKEFVHGDFNRTVPNVRTLLNRSVDIVALDVDNVELDWPPAVHRNGKC